jgi:hypothetical protein
MLRQVLFAAAAVLFATPAAPRGRRRHAAFAQAGAGGRADRAGRRRGVSARAAASPPNSVAYPMFEFELRPPSGR